MLELCCRKRPGRKPASFPVYLRVTVSNGVQQEIHYIQLEDEEDLEAYHTDEWDYETEINLQLDYSGRDMLGDHEEITYEVYQQHQHIAHGQRRSARRKPATARRKPKPARR
jgi:hypothetical protein